MKTIRLPILLSVALVLVTVAYYVRDNTWQTTERQLAVANRTIIDLSSQLDDANQELAQLQPLADKALRIPISVSCKKLIIGCVVHLQNRSDKSLPLQLTASNSTVNKTKTFDLILDPKAPREISHLEEWVLSSGDEIEVTSAGFTPINAKIP